MNTYEIEESVKKNKCLSKYFLGVFPSDRLPKINEKPCCFIANTAPSNESGQHWVALFFDKRVEYFDSYGLKPLEAFKVYKPEWYNTYCLQGLETAVCGEYCIYFLSYRSLGTEPDKIIKKLYKRSDADKFVKIFVDRLRAGGTINNCQSCTYRGRQ